MADATEILHNAVKTAAAESTVTITPRENNELAKAVVNQVNADPVAKNALSQEPWWQSGVALGGGGGVIGSAIILFHEIPLYGTADFDWNVAGPAGMTIVAAIYTLYRRFMPGLKPLFSRWTG